MTKKVSARRGAAAKVVKVVKTLADREADCVAGYARIAELKAELAAIEKVCRKDALELFEDAGLNILQGVEGVLTISTKAGASRLDTGKVRALLTAEQVHACTVVGDVQTVVKFTARQ